MGGSHDDVIAMVVGLLGSTTVRDLEVFSLNFLNDENTLEKHEEFQQVLSRIFAPEQLRAKTDSVRWSRITADRVGLVAGFAHCEPGEALQRQGGAG